MRKMLIPERECEVVRNKQRDSGAFEGNYCCTIAVCFLKRKETKNNSKRLQNYWYLTSLSERQPFHPLYKYTHHIIFVYTL